jgi:hypothetical protein
MNDSAGDTIKVDTARLPLLLRELRLPTIAAMWQSFTERADREGWPAARFRRRYVRRIPARIPLVASHQRIKENSFIPN